MKVYLPKSSSPITPNNDKIDYHLDSDGHIKGTIKNPNIDMSKMASRKKFTTSLSRLFGFQRKITNNGKAEIQFVKVDPNSEMRVAQSKVGKVMKTRMGDRLEEYFNFWLNETTDTISSLQDRFKRVAELEFAIMNDPFLGMVVDLMADEATQIDQQGQLIMVDCANPRMKQRMEELLTQWSVTQNRVRSCIWNLAGYGDSFWSVKVTKNGVIRINPLDVRQVLDRLEFNPARVASDMTMKQGFLTALSRDERLQMLVDSLENPANDEFADIFDSKLFGFVIANDFVVPPWNITHFRTQAEQSDFFPFGKPLLLKALAPFRQANATMTLQSLARILSFPVTVYSVKTTAGMDEAQQFEKVNEAREEYDNIGVSGSNTETYSVNTKMWIPEGLIELKVHTPNIDLNAIGDLELYQDRVVVASGVPKGYLVPDWGGFGVSAISLTEQFKPFARKIFTLQSAFIDGLTNLFRLHFAITGEFDYFEPFVLSMKFPNSENSAERVQAKQSSLDLSKNVIDTVADVIGSLNDPLPPEIVQDILTKFSFLDPEDIKKWIKVRATKSQGEGIPDESGVSGGGSAGGAGGIGVSPSGELGGELGGGDAGDEEGSPDASEIDDSQFGGSDIDLDGGENVPEGEANNPEFSTEEVPEGGENVPEPSLPSQKGNKNESYSDFAKKRLTEKRVIELTRRYEKGSSVVYENVIKSFAKFDEITTNNRHYKFANIEDVYSPTYKVLKDYYKNGVRNNRELKETVQDLMKLNIKFENEKNEELDIQEVSLSGMLNKFMGDYKEVPVGEYGNEGTSENDADSEEFMTHHKKSIGLREDVE